VTSTEYPQQIARIVEEGLLSIEIDPTKMTAAGREATRFRSAIFSLVNFVARRGSQENLAVVAEGLVGNLQGFIQDQGWPAPQRDQDLELRGYGYETIGLLAKAAPNKILLEPNLSLLQWLFRSLRDDASGRDVAVSIEEALSSVLGAFSKPFDTSVEDSFRRVLLTFAQSNPPTNPGESEKFFRSTRYVATRFANRCLPYNDVLARWIDILAVSGGAAERHEVVEEGRKGLDPYWFEMQNNSPGSDTSQTQLIFPDFTELVRFIFAQLARDDDGMDIDSGDNTPLVSQLQQHHASTIPTIISFCTQVAMHAALTEKGIEDRLSEDWGRQLETLLSTDQRARQAFRSWAASFTVGLAPSVSSPLGSLLGLCFDKLTQNELSDPGEISSIFVRFLSLCPEAIWQQARLLQKLSAVVPSVLSNNPTRRAATAHAYGLLASHPDCDQDFVTKSHQTFYEKAENWNTAVGGELNQISGIIVALGYYYSRLHWRNQAAFPDDHSVYRLLSIVVNILKDSRDTTLKAAAFSCIDQLGLFQVITPSTISKYAKFQDVAQQIYDSAKSGTTGAILALGHLSMITEEDADSQGSETSDYDFIADKLHELHEVRQSEVQFSVGEAFSCFCIGWDSKALIAELDVEHPDQKHDPWDATVLTPSGPKREKTLIKVVEKALKGCQQSKPSLKKASVIWLLCLLQYCGHKAEFQNYLGQCQNAFKVCLSDRDEVVQEAASRGLGLVYEKGDRQLKDDLVRDLVSSFSDNKSKLAGGNISEDTQLFEPGALPVGEGKSVTTYKDILNLAQEVGDNSLVYRFMSLASNNSIWTSRAAFGRFGLSNVFSDSSVDGYLAENAKLYPKLFRYRYVSHQLNVVRC
jgi:proteasome component ECM29